MQKKNEYSFIDFFTHVPARISILLLIITNFICNNLFLFQLKYYAEDWFLYVYPQPPFISVSYALLESQRPLTIATHVLLSQIAYTPLVFHLLSFLMTTIGLILIYFIFRKIFRDFGNDGELYPFLGAMIFCILFNKDEIYAWPTLSNSLVRITAILTIYLYLNKEKRYYLGLSCLTYLLCLFSSEYGAAIPAILFAYDYLLGRDWKESFYFAIPLAAYLTIRLTRWFGFGWNVYDHPVKIGNTGTLVNSLQYPIMTLTDFYDYLVWSVYGYAQMGVVLIVVLCLINLVLLVLILRYLKNISVENKTKLDFRLPLFALIIIVVFWSPFIVGAYRELPARANYLTDIGISLLLLCGLILLREFVDIKKLAVIIIILCVFINQGLFYNWVVEGNIIEKVDHYVGENAGVIAKFNYIYYDPASFLREYPHEPGIRDLFSYPTFQEFRRLAGLPNQTPVIQLKNKYNYASYYNVRGLSYHALNSIIDARKSSNFTLIYQMNWPPNRVVPVNITAEKITYKRMPNGIISSVYRNSVFEINYSAVYSAR